MDASIFDITAAELFSQLAIGLINGAFYSMLSIGLAVIFGLLNVINFVHGAQYMMGAFVAWLGLRYLGLNYWVSLIVAPLIVGLFGALLERLILRRVYKLDHLYGFLLTVGLAQIIEGLFRARYGTSGQPYSIPTELSGALDLGFMYLPNYRAWVIVASVVVCLSVWLIIEKTRLGSYLRAATENPQLVEAFGVNVPWLITITYTCGVGLAALSGVMAAPIYQVSPLMGTNLIIVVFAVVVIGGMGSIFGAIVSGFSLGLVESLTKVFYPEASNTVIFVLMAIVLLLKPAGLFGTAQAQVNAPPASIALKVMTRARHMSPPLVCVLLVMAVILPFFVYPVLLMKALCFALFASAFHLLIGYVGLMSFGHAAYFGMASYITAYTIKTWHLSPELGILAGTGVAAALGAVFGLIAIRRQGIYFAMVTLALAQLVFFFCWQAPFTGGEDGVQGVPRGYLFGLFDLSNAYIMYFFVLTICLFGLCVIYRIINSPFGAVLNAIRDNEVRAVSLGYHTAQYKLLAFILSATLAGLAGSTKSLVFQLASLTDVNYGMSGDVVLMALVGGVGTFLGPIVGAFVLISMESYLVRLGSWYTVIQGLIFVFCVLSFRQGIVGEIYAWLHRRTQSRLQRIANT